MTFRLNLAGFLIPVQRFFYENNFSGVRALKSDRISRQTNTFAQLFLQLVLAVGLESEQASRALLC